MIGSFLILMSLLGTGASRSEDHLTSTQPIAIENVTVVPMDTDRVIPAQTVLIRDGRIAAIGPLADVALPENVACLDGTGAFLMPGLVDMHVHLWHEEEFPLFIANGVLAVRNMWGDSRHLKWRRLAEKLPDTYFPLVYTTGPIFDGRPPVWPASRPVDSVEDAAAAVAETVEQGYGAIKVYSRLSKPVYEALVAAAREKGLRVSGHVPNAVGLSGALAASQDSIEHLSGYLLAIQGTEAPTRRRSGLRASAEFIDPELIPKIVADTVRAKSWNCPTLTVLDHIANLDRRVEAWEARPEMRFVSPSTRERWDPRQDFRFRNRGFPYFDRQRADFEVHLQITRALHEGGARLLLGTDTPNPYVVPGYSIHEELAHLVAAGLSPFEAYCAGSRDAAEFLGEPSEFGTVEVGRRADLVLLSKNPLTDVKHFRSQRGVILRGAWFGRSALESRLEKVANMQEAKKDR